MLINYEIGVKFISAARRAQILNIAGHNDQAISHRIGVSVDS